MKPRNMPTVRCMRFMRGMNAGVASVAVALTSLVGLADAAVISVTNSFAAASARTGNGAPVSVTVADWGLDGGNAVVVLFGAENSDGVTSATFAGEAMTIVNSFDGARHLASFAYLIDPLATSGDVVINANNSSTSRLSNAYAVFSLANVGAFADSNTRTSAGSLGFSTSLDGGYVLAAAANNNYKGPAPVIGGIADEILFSQPVDGNQSTTFAHGDVPTAGTFSIPVSNGLAAAGVAFVPVVSVPEPGSLAALAVAGVCLLCRRPRR